MRNQTVTDRRPNLEQVHVFKNEYWDYVNNEYEEEKSLPQDQSRNTNNHRRIYSNVENSTNIKESSSDNYGSSLFTTQNRSQAELRNLGKIRDSIKSERKEEAVDIPNSRESRNQHNLNVSLGDSSYQ